MCCKCTADYSYGQSAKRLMSFTDRMTHADAILHHLLSMCIVYWYELGLIDALERSMSLYLYSRHMSLVQ